MMVFEWFTRFLGNNFMYCFWTLKNLAYSGKWKKWQNTTESWVNLLSIFLPLFFLITYFLVEWRILYPSTELWQPHYQLPPLVTQLGYETKVNRDKCTPWSAMCATRLSVRAIISRNIQHLSWQSSPALFANHFLEKIGGFSIFCFSYGAHYGFPWQ